MRAHRTLGSSGRKRRATVTLVRRSVGSSATSSRSSRPTSPRRRWRPDCVQERRPGTLKIGSEDFTVNATVKAEGPAGAVAKYKIGFLQTLLGSYVSYHYEPADRYDIWLAYAARRIISVRG